MRSDNDESVSVDNRSEQPAVNVLTRSQAREVAELESQRLDREEEELWCMVEGEESAQDALGVELEPSVKKGEAETVQECERESVDEVDEENGVPVELEREAECKSELESKLREIASEIEPVRSGESNEEFRRELREDASLREWRELGDRRERGFAWKKEVLVRGLYVTWEEYMDVLVVPMSFRKRIMTLGHKRNGHLSGEKVAAMVGRYFLWPGMIKDVLAHCSSCSECQLRSKHRTMKAPVVERPILTEPFKSVAVDLVGPLPKGKGGHLATKWPEAVPLRRVTARAVAEGLWSIFSRTAIPERLLSDQGSQFCGKVVKELCGLLGIEKLRTSPYHPETNGAVERMHGTFKSILGKCIAEGLDWVGQVCFVLFVLRQMPNSDSGFSPFNMVFGFRVRTPLDALYHGFYEMEGKEMGVCEWVNGLAERLDLMRDCAALKLGKSRESRLKYVNRGSKSRELEEGSLVLYRVPGMSSKLADSWEGPYKVLAKKDAVNYKIGKVGAETHAKVVHINCLKQYVERRTVNRLDVVLEEHVTATKVLSGVYDGFVQEELDELSEYGEVFSDRPGGTERVVLKIDTGSHAPIRQVLYSVPLGIRDAVKKELEELEESGIIERSSSPWSSPLVPVRKPDGGVRLCVDYRKLNAITTREPYCMPTLEEMLERVGTGCVLSKVDLAKGFHQVAVDPEHKEKTCFTCPFGKFQYCRMPFGLTNAPAIFQRLMDEVLVNCSDFTNVYIDDILVVSRSWGVHLEHLRELFRTLKEAGLTCKIGKCEFGRKKMMFLGHEIGEGAICVPEARVQALREHPRPKTRRQLRAFLGLVGYYRRFIAGFHRWSSLLTPHTAAKGNERVEWTDPMLVAFSELCNV